MYLKEIQCELTDCIRLAQKGRRAAPAYGDNELLGYHISDKYLGYLINCSPYKEYSA
jgi:hypothetical protein